MSEFLAHEQKFFARERVLIGVEQTEIGELLPHITGHFVEERIFAVDDFVVGKGQNEIFAEGVDQGKSDFVVFVLAVDGIGGKIS